MNKGNKIRILRENKNLSQVDLAKMIGVSKQTLYKYENDIVTNIPSDKIEALAKALDSTPAYIMGWDKKTIATINDSEFSEIKKDFIKFIDTLSDDQIIKVRELLETALHLGEK